MTTPDNITSLLPNSVFVFGSNGIGSHNAGAAKVAHENFGYPMGVSTGIVGQAYGIDTMGRIDKMKQDIEQFVLTAKSLPALTFYLTKVGCGIAGYEEEYMKELFQSTPNNVIKPKGW